jgi:hypothetical protein
METRSGQTVAPQEIATEQLNEGGAGQSAPGESVFGQLAVPVGAVVPDGLRRFLRLDPKHARDPAAPVPSPEADAQG